ncbi:MAG: hypothetical protein FWG39_00860 [Alphaproteobacteria bacterium]|nr:hypothetical protein [Alphaproteobacteria bacterium]
MNNKEFFDMANISFAPPARKTLYQGSDKEIKGGFLEPQPSSSNAGDKRVTAVFATSDYNYAKRFALRKCLAGGPQTINLINNKLLFSELKENPDEVFYVYSVDGAGFEHDVGTEYMRFERVRIDGVQIIDVAQELESNAWEIYIKDDDFDKDYKKIPRDDGAQKSKFIDECIKSGRIKRVTDIPKQIRRQRAARAAIMANKKTNG